MHHSCCPCVLLHRLCHAMDSCRCSCASLGYFVLTSNSSKHFQRCFHAAPHPAHPAHRVNSDQTLHSLCSLCLLMASSFVTTVEQTAFVRHCPLAMEGDAVALFASQTQVLGIHRVHPKHHNRCAVAYRVTLAPGASVAILRRIHHRSLDFHCCRCLVFPFNFPSTTCRLTRSEQPWLTASWLTYNKQPSSDFGEKNPLVGACAHSWETYHRNVHLTIIQY
jgi:hypothetical protein